MKKIILTIGCIAALICAKGQTIDLVAGNATGGFSGDGGTATAAQLQNCSSLVFDGAGNMYIADQSNHRIRKVSTTGVISTWAGTGTAGYSGDGGQATDADIDDPSDIVIDASGNLYFAGGDVIRKIDPSGVISTFAGIYSHTTSGWGHGGDGGPATDAQFASCRSMTFDASGNLYVADEYNNLIRKITPAGIISTVVGNNTYAGSSGYSGDGGQATDALIYSPHGLAFDASGNLYISDGGNAVIRKVTPAGIISRFAGIPGSHGYSGDGGQATNARLDFVIGLVFDAAGDLYLSDYYRAVVRKINTSGIINTVAGVGVNGYSGDGDGSAATLAHMFGPAGIAVGPDGSLYLCAKGNHVVRKLLNAPTFTNGTGQNISVCTNWVTSSINSFLKVTDYASGATLTWSVVSGPSYGTAVAAYSTTSTGGVVTPVGLSYTPSSGFVGYDAFVVQVTDGTHIATTTINVMVNALPSMPSVSGTSSICVGSSTTLSGTPSGGSWNSGAGSVFTYTAGTVTGTHGGSGVINYRVYNAAGCWNQAPTTINVLVPGAITGFSGGSAVSNVCPGGTFTLAHPTTGGTWSSSNNAIATVSGGMVTAVASGRDTIYYTVTNACGSASARWPFTVTGAPAVAGISGYSVPFCTGATRMLADVTSGGSWTTSSGSVASVSASGSLYGVSPGVAIISYSVTNSCGITGTATRVVSVLALPYAGTISGPASVVNGSTITLSTSGSGGTWSSLTPAIATVNSAGLVRGRSVGSDMIYYTVSNYCGTDIASYSIDVTASRGAAENGNGSVLNENAGIKLYPNPTTRIINLELVGGANHGNLSITDVSGKSVYSTVINNEKSSIDMSFLPAGVYIFNVCTENGNFTGKVVVE